MKWSYHNAGPQEHPRSSCCRRKEWVSCLGCLAYKWIMWATTTSSALECQFMKRKRLPPPPRFWEKRILRRKWKMSPIIGEKMQKWWESLFLLVFFQTLFKIAKNQCTDRKSNSGLPLTVKVFFQWSSYVYIRLSYFFSLPEKIGGFPTSPHLYLALWQRYYWALSEDCLVFQKLNLVMKRCTFVTDASLSSLGIVNL